MLRYLANRGSRSLVALGLAAGLSACSLIPDSAPVQSWMLEPANTVDKGAVALSDLRVLRPQVQDLLNGRYLLVVPEDQPLSVYADNRWSASIPVLWRDYLVDALQSDSRFAGISSDEVRIDARYELVSRLDAFQSEYRDGRPQAVMSAYLQLIDSNSRSLIAERPLELSQPVQGIEASAVVDAFSALMAEAGVEVGDWLLQETSGQRQ